MVIFLSSRAASDALSLTIVIVSETNKGAYQRQGCAAIYAPAKCGGPISTVTKTIAGAALLLAALPKTAKSTYLVV